MPVAVPECRCRVCGQVMEAKYQPGPEADRPGYFILTCWKPDCAMNGYTLAEKTYAEVDLASYLNRAGDTFSKCLAEHQAANPPGARLFG